MPGTQPTDAFPEPTRLGATFWLVGTLAFLGVMIAAELAYGCGNFGGCYNPLTDPISNLGSAGFSGNPPTYTANGMQIAWPYSPLWPLFNYGIMAFGVLIVLGVFRLSGAFPRSMGSTVFLGIFALAGFGAAGVGIVPEDTILALHSLFALVAFAGAGLALLAVALPLGNDPRWGRTWEVYTLASGLFSVIVTVVFNFPAFGLGPAWAVYGGGFGYGGMERLIIAAPLAWLVVASVHILTASPATDLSEGPSATVEGIA